MKEFNSSIELFQIANHCNHPEYLLTFPYLWPFLLLLLLLARYNRTGWLGIKHQYTYLLTYFFLLLFFFFFYFGLGGGLKAVSVKLHLFWLKSVYQSFNMCNAHSSCRACARRRDGHWWSCTSDDWDGRTQQRFNTLWRPGSEPWPLDLQSSDLANRPWTPVASWSQTLAIGFTVQRFNHSATSSSCWFGRKELHSLRKTNVLWLTPSTPKNVWCYCSSFTKESIRRRC